MTTQQKMRLTLAFPIHLFQLKPFHRRLIQPVHRNIVLLLRHPPKINYSAQTIRIAIFDPWPCYPSGKRRVFLHPPISSSPAAALLAYGAPITLRSGRQSSASPSSIAASSQPAPAPATRASPASAASPN